MAVVQLMIIVHVRSPSIPVTPIEVPNENQEFMTTK
jgi:hypothetical protein